MKKGDRIRLVSMGPDPCPIPAGSEGTVILVNEGIYPGTTDVTVEWDSDRSLSLIMPPDVAVVVKEI